MRRLFAVLVIVGLLIAGLVVLFPGRATAATTRHGGWADSIVWSRQGDGSLATAAMDAGTMNMWLYYYATQAQLQAAQSDPDVRTPVVRGRPTREILALVDAELRGTGDGSPDGAAQESGTR